MSDTIIYYGGFSLPDKNAAANRVVSNGKIFKSLGYNVIFLGADYEDNSYTGIRSLSENMFTEVHPTGVAQWLRQILIFKNLKEIVKNRDSVKLVILYNVPFVTLCIAKSFFRKYGIEVAYDCTEWTQSTEGNFVKKAFKYIDELFVRKFTHKVADRVIVISRMMENAYKGTKKLLRLPPLVDLSDNIWHQKADKTTGEFVFCFAGFPGGNKEHLHKVAQAFMKLADKNVVLKIAGVEKVQFCTMYPEIKPSSNIEFLGRLSHADTIKLIMESDCYVFVRPSDRRNNAGFPTKFVESYTCGATVITTDVSDVKQYADKTDDCVILENTNEDELCQAMTSVMAKYDPSQTKSLRADFDYNNFIDETRLWLN